MKRIGLVFCFILAFAMLFPSPVRSQTTPPKTPQLSEVESLKIQNFALKYQQRQTAIDEVLKEQASLRSQYQALLSAIEAEYPGYTVDPNGSDGPTLVEKPKPAPAKAPEVSKPAKVEPKK